VFENNNLKLEEVSMEPEVMLLTAAKVAEKLGVSAGQVRKLIKEAGIKPDLVKSGCSYYGAETLNKMKELLGG